MPGIDNFKDHVPELILDDTCRQSAVAVPLVEKGGEWFVLFEQRSGKLSENAGDLCFPGGMQEPGETPKETALRELREELCLREEQIEYVGAGDVFHNLAVLVRSFVVILKEYKNTFETTEVKSVCLVPLRQLMEAGAECYPMEWLPAPGEDFPYERVSGGKDHKFRRQKYRQVFYETPAGWVWGITGKILSAFLSVAGSQRLKDHTPFLF